MHPSPVRLCSLVDLDTCAWPHPCAFEMAVELEIPEDVAIQQKLAGKRGALGAALFKSGDDQAALQMQQEIENQPGWWQSEDGKPFPQCGVIHLVWRVGLM